MHRAHTADTRPATIFIHNGAPQALVGSQELTSDWYPIRGHLAPPTLAMSPTNLARCAGSRGRLGYAQRVLAVLGKRLARFALA